MAGGGQVFSCPTANYYWQKLPDKRNEPNKLTVVEFTAKLSGFYLTFPPLDDLATKLTNVIFLRVDVNVDELRSLAEQHYGVKAIPTLVLLKGGSKEETIVGANKDDLLMAIAKHATAP